MKFLTVLGLTLLCLSAWAQKKESVGQIVLGADGIDEKMAQKLAEQSSQGVKKPVVEEEPEQEEEGEKKTVGKQAPMIPDNIKEKLREDRRAMKRLKQEVKSLKNRIHDRSLSKNAKKQLKAQYSSLKRGLKEKKNEIKDLKMLKRQSKQGSKGGAQRGGKRGGRLRGRGGRGKNKKGFKKHGAKKTLLNEDNAAEVLEADDEERVKVLTKSEKKAQRKLAKKQQRKAAKRRGRKGMSLIIPEDEMLSQGKKRNKKQQRGGDKKPANFAGDFLLLRNFGSGGLPVRPGFNKHKTRCEQDSDCSDGAICKENKRGKKVCRKPHRKRAMGRPCRRSRQCAEGLKCLMPSQSIVSWTGRKHPGKRGMCVDPKTVDSNMGHFKE